MEDETWLTPEAQAWLDTQLKKLFRGIWTPIYIPPSVEDLEEEKKDD